MCVYILISIGVPAHGRFFFFFIFSHFYVGSMCLMRRLHLGRSCASSDNPLSDKLFLMLSNHLRFNLFNLQFVYMLISIGVPARDRFNLFNLQFVYTLISIGVPARDRFNMFNLQFACTLISIGKQWAKYKVSDSGHTALSVSFVLRCRRATSCTSWCEDRYGMKLSLLKHSSDVRLVCDSTTSVPRRPSTAASMPRMSTPDLLYYCQLSSDPSFPNFS